MNVIPMRVNNLPILFLAVVGKLVSESTPQRSLSERTETARHFLRRAEIPLPDDIAGQLADELVELAADVADRERFLLHFDKVERRVRYMAVGVDMALTGHVHGEPFFRLRGVA